MNYCPECGRVVELKDTAKDAATTHHTYECFGGHKWEETVSDDVAGETLHISPVYDEGDDSHGS